MWYLGLRYFDYDDLLPEGRPYLEKDTISRIRKVLKTLSLPYSMFKCLQGSVSVWWTIACPIWDLCQPIALFFIMMMALQFKDMQLQTTTNDEGEEVTKLVFEGLPEEDVEKIVKETKKILLFVAIVTFMVYSGRRKWTQKDYFHVADQQRHGPHGHMLGILSQ